MDKVQREIFFSIIIPIYNMEKYLEECISSIKCQKIDDYEIVLVDDGSRDSSFQIAEKLSEQYVNVKCFKKENGGVASARNYGIEKAKGKYLIFLDADDKMVGGALENAYKAIADSNFKEYDLIVCNAYKEFCKNIEQENVLFSENILKEELSTKETKILCQNLSSMCIGIYKRSFLQDNNLRINETITCAEDTDFFFRSLVASNSIKIIRCTLFSYRYNRESVSNNLTYKNVKDVLKVCSERMNLLLKNPIEDIDNDKALNFFGTKFIHFGIKASGMCKEEKKELILFMKQNRNLLKYEKAKPDKIYAMLVDIVGERIAVWIFYCLVKIRNSIQH